MALQRLVAECDAEARAQHRHAAVAFRRRRRIHQQVGPVEDLERKRIVDACEQVRRWPGVDVRPDGHALRGERVGGGEEAHRAAELLHVEQRRVEPARAPQRFELRDLLHRLADGQGRAELPARVPERGQIRVGRRILQPQERRARAFDERCERRRSSSCTLRRRRCTRRRGTPCGPRRSVAHPYRRRDRRASSRSGSPRPGPVRLRRRAHRGWRRGSSHSRTRRARRCAGGDPTDRRMRRRARERPDPTQPGRWRSSPRATRSARHGAAGAPPPGARRATEPRRRGAPQRSRLRRRAAPRSQAPSSPILRAAPNARPRRHGRTCRTGPRA